MKRKIRYTDEKLGRLRVIDDFLPEPSRLASKELNVKVTISLSERSLLFFKDQALKHRTAYQKMIRNLLDTYAAHYTK